MGEERRYQLSVKYGGKTIDLLTPLKGCAKDLGYEVEIEPLNSAIIGDHVEKGCVYYSVVCRGDLDKFERKVGAMGLSAKFDEIPN
jgi:hypothetical protein